MRLADSPPIALFVSCAAAMIAGCAGGGPQESAVTLPAATARSTMLHMAKKSILIYAAANDTNHVDVFDYSNGVKGGYPAIDELGIHILIFVVPATGAWVMARFLP